MHMADALLSPAVGGTMWVATATLIGICAKNVQKTRDDASTPLMGVLGAFIFAAQMINFTLPGTGSSGHLGGGMILAILLGPSAAFLTMASVLTIQALFFADGGLLALGCNIFNLGFFPCFLAYPLLYQKIAGRVPTKSRIIAGSLVAAIVGLQLGALAVVMETLFSGLTELPFTHFVLLMQPIHLAIGIVEGLATAAVMIFIWQARPELLANTTATPALQRVSLKPVLIGLSLATLLTGGMLSWFASAHPDGLEWAMFHTSGKEELPTPTQRIYAALANLQTKTAILPDYTFKTADAESAASSAAWPAVDPGTSFSGLVGGAFIFLVMMGLGWGLNGKKTRA